MQFDSLSQNERDPGRARRLLVGYASAVIVIAALLVTGVVFGGQIKKQVFEEEVDVKLVKKVEAPPAPPPPPPPPPPKPKKVAVAKGPADLGNATPPPKEIPKELPREGDPQAPKAEVQHYDGTGDPNGVRGGKGNGAGITTVASAQPANPPAPTQVLPEAASAPVALEKVMPAYPEEARKQGIEAVIVVKFVVSEKGTVEEPVIVKGNALFDTLVLTAVRLWKFQPAMLDGVPLRVRRLVKIPFRLRTQ